MTVPARASAKTDFSSTGYPRGNFVYDGANGRLPLLSATACVYDVIPELVPLSNSPTATYVPAGGTRYAGWRGFTLPSNELAEETGLDYFGARYYSGAQGRFTSPDEPLEDQDRSDPQSWNLYSYVRNNPLRFVDPNGEDCVTTSDQTRTSVTVGVERGGSEKSCTQGGGAWVAGTVDMKSLTFNGSSVGYSYSPYDANSLTSGGTVYLGRVAPMVPGELDPYAKAVFSQPVIGHAAGTINDYIAPPLMLFLMFAEPEAAGPEITPLWRLAKPTGRYAAGNLKEQLAMEQAKARPQDGTPVPLKKGMTDSRWPASKGWQKMRQNMSGVEIHYLWNKVTGAVADFKFK